MADNEIINNGEGRCWWRATKNQHMENWKKKGGPCPHDMQAVTVDGVTCCMCKAEVFKDEISPGSVAYQFAKERPDVAKEISE